MYHKGVGAVADVVGENYVDKRNTSKGLERRAHCDSPNVERQSGVMVSMWVRVGEGAGEGQHCSGEKLQGVRF